MRRTSIAVAGTVLAWSLLLPMPTFSEPQLKPTAASAPTTPAGWLSAETRLNKVWVSGQAVEKLKLLDPLFADCLEIASLPKRAQFPLLLKMAGVYTANDPFGQQGLSTLGAAFDKLEALMLANPDAGAALDDLLNSRRELSVLAESTAEGDLQAAAKLRTISGQIVPSPVGKQVLLLRSMTLDFRMQERDRGRRGIGGASKVNSILGSYTVEGAKNVLDLIGNYDPSRDYAPIAEDAAKILRQLIESGALDPKCREITTTWRDPSKDFGPMLRGYSSTTVTRCGI